MKVDRLYFTPMSVQEFAEKYNLTLTLRQEAPDHGPSFPGNPLVIKYLAAFDGVVASQDGTDQAGIGDSEVEALNDYIQKISLIDVRLPPGPTVGAPAVVTVPLLQMIRSPLEIPPPPTTII
jgi:hypothetical protein